MGAGAGGSVGAGIRPAGGTHEGLKLSDLEEEVEYDEELDRPVAPMRD